MHSPGSNFKDKKGTQRQFSFLPLPALFSSLEMDNVFLGDILCVCIHKQNVFTCPLQDINTVHIVPYLAFSVYVLEFIAYQYTRSFLL